MGLGEGGWGKGGGVGWGGGRGWGGPWGPGGPLGGPGEGVGGLGVGGDDRTPGPYGPIDPFKGIPIVDPHLYGSAESHFVVKKRNFAAAGNSQLLTRICKRNASN